MTRNNTLRDYEMELAEVATDKNLDLKKKDVPGKNEEFIGLNYDQFVKSIMLAQGEFAQFLKVDKSNRGELLEKITGTGIYRKLGKRAFEKKNELANVLEDLRKVEAIYRESLMEDEELEGVEKNHLEFGKESQAKSKKLNVLEKQLQLRKDFSKIDETRKTKEEEVGSRKNKLQEFQEGPGEQLKRHEATAPFAEKLVQWKSLHEEFSKTKEKIESLQNDHNKAQEERGGLLRKVSELLQEQVNDATVKEDLNHLQKKVEEIEREISEKAIEYRGKKSELITKGEGWEFVPDGNSHEVEMQKLHAWRAETRVLIKKLQEQLKDISLNEPESEDNRMELKIQSLRQGNQWSNDLEKLHQKDREEKELLNTNKKEKQAFPERIEKLTNEKEKNALKERAMNLQLENQRLRASLEDKRTALNEGEPCPLCGSAEHPWAAHAPEDDDQLTIKLEEIRTVLENSRSGLISAEERYKSLMKEQDERQKRLETLKEEIESCDQKLKMECGEWLKNEPVDWHNLIEQTKNQRESLKQFNLLQKKAKGIESCIPVLESIILISAEVQQLTDQKEQLYKGDDIGKECTELRDSWQSINFRLQSLIGQQLKIKEEDQKLEKQKKLLFEELTPSLKKLDFNGIEAAISQRLSEEGYQQLNRQLNNLKETLNTSETEMKSMLDQLSGMKEQLTDEAIEELNGQHNQLKNELLEIQADWEEVKRKLKNQSENLQKIEEFQIKIAIEAKTGRRWELLNQLIGDATGKKFNDFAQDLTLQQLLALANIRLSLLTDRYSVASPAEEEDDSLVAIDNHMGGQRRSVKTLSGGETFVMSLSLALALSDLASKNVEINSLFIDEGFGTLDPETLDQTLDTLEKLQTESSKTIGIISHVEALKERISTQIQLERNGQGYSKLTVV